MDMNPFDLIKNMKGIQENMKRMQEILPTITRPEAPAPAWSRSPSTASSS